MPFKPSSLLKPLQEAITPALPPFSEVKRVFGKEDELQVLVSVLTPRGMKPLLTVTLSMSQAGTAWTDGRGIRNQEPWFAHQWQRWERIQKDVATRVEMVTTTVWAVGGVA